MTSYSRYLSDDHTPIFLFHGVVDELRHSVRNYIRKHIPKDYFGSVLSDLSQSGHAISLDEWIDVSMNGGSQRDLPKRSYVITFDDGFENNHSIAAPILDAMRTPATFYVTSNFIDANGMSWVDVIECAFEMQGSFSLSLPIVSVEGRLSSPKDKISALMKIRAVLKNDPSIDPYAFAEDVLRQMGISELAFDKGLDQKMSWKQVSELEKNSLFRVGGHGHSHRILDFLSDRELQKEIDLSIELLKTKAGIVSHHYCYPDGQANCYSDRVIGLLKERGITCSPSAIEGTNRIGDDLFHLRRIMVI